jgi:hypothetical protein
MKLLLTLYGVVLLNTNLISSFRSLYKEAPFNEDKANELLQKAEKNMSLGHLYKGYFGAVKIISAQYAFNPYTKWTLFSEGKNILESAINADKNNIELRYLRLTIQMNAPFFLGYSSQISSDTEYLTKNASGIKDEELKAIINSYLLSIK